MVLGPPAETAPCSSLSVSVQPSVCGPRAQVSVSHYLPSLSTEARNSRVWHVAAELITSALLPCPRSQAYATDSTESVWMPTHPSLWVRSSQPLLFSGSLLFTSVCVGRALTLGPEALLKKVRFRGLVGGPGTVLGEEETGTQEKQITHSSAGGGTF